MSSGPTRPLERLRCGCGYGLAGLPLDSDGLVRCPECGTLLDPAKARPAPPHSRAWLWIPLWPWPLPLIAAFGTPFGGPSIFGGPENCAMFLLRAMPFVFAISAITFFAAATQPSFRKRAPLPLAAFVWVGGSINFGGLTWVWAAFLGSAAC